MSIKILDENDIVQTTGTSETAVMSQAAVTRELEAANEKINFNANEIKRLERIIPPPEYYVDDSVAYVKDVPANVLPYAEINKIGGMTYNDGDTLKSAKVTEVEIAGANLIPPPTTEQSDTANGGTITFSTDGVLTASGTFTANTFFLISIVNLEVGQTYAFTLGEQFVNTETGYVLPLTSAGGTFVAETESVRLSLVLYASTTERALTLYPMLNKGSTALEFTPYVKNTFPIPEAVQALDGYGEGNPDNAEEYNAIIWNEDGSVSYSHKGDIADNEWVSLATPEVTDISDIFTADNFIEVEGGGTLTFKNEYEYDVPSEVTYVLEVTE